MSLFDNGFYYCQNDNKYKAIKVTNDLNKCTFCDFYFSGKCTADKELFKVCEALNDYYWSIQCIETNDENYSFKYDCKYINLNI